MADDEIAAPVRSRKVDIGLFSWIVTALATLVFTLTGYLFTEIAALRAENAATRAKLESQREQNTSILISLTEIKGDVRALRDRVEVPRR